MLEFVEEGHVYTWKGSRVPSVTTIIDDIADTMKHVRKDVLKLAQDRGTYVHRMCERIDNGQATPDQCDVRFAGYVKAWENFKETCQVKIISNETRVFSKSYCFAGQIDRTLSMVPPKKRSRSEWILDIKTGPPSKSHEPQLGAYHLALKEYTGKNIPRMACIHLKPDGSWSMKAYDKRAQIIFLSILSVWKHFK